jgi:hypothetical protein
MVGLLQAAGFTTGGFFRGFITNVIARPTAPAFGWAVGP